MVLGDFLLSAIKSQESREELLAGADCQICCGLLIGPVG